MLQRLGVPPERCLVVEDSLVGLRAAAAAGMECIITPTQSSDKVCRRTLPFWLLHYC